MPRPVGAAQPLRNLAQRHPGLEFRLEHLLHRRGEQGIDPFLFGQAAIPVEVARIGGEVLARPELDRIDKETDNGFRAERSRQPHQRQMPLMEPPHGGHENDALPLFSPAAGYPDDLFALFNQFHCLTLRRAILSSITFFPGSAEVLSARVERYVVRVSMALSVFP